MAIYPSNNTTITAPGTGMQFFSTVYVYGASGMLIETQPVTATNWYVNDIAGGSAAVGTISSVGFYTPPNYYVPINQYLKISATYTFSSVPLSGWLAVPIYQATETSPVCIIQCISQINIFLGDGRHAYIPSGTYFSLTPGSYWVAQYQETLDANFLPINIGNSQNLSTSMFMIDGQSNMMEYITYNENTVIPDTTTGGAFTRTYSFVLGICDPVTGRFQSMWQMLDIVTQIQNSIPAQTNSCSA